MIVHLKPNWVEYATKTSVSHPSIHLSSNDDGFLIMWNLQQHHSAVKSFEADNLICTEELATKY